MTYTSIKVKSFNKIRPFERNDWTSRAQKAVLFVLPHRPGSPNFDGRSFGEIAEAEGVSKRRVQDVIDLALLAPDILEIIAAGEQPDALATNYLI